MAKKKVYAVAVGRQGVAIYDSCTDTSAGTINIDQLSYLKLFFFFPTNVCIAMWLTSEIDGW